MTTRGSESGRPPAHEVYERLRGMIVTGRIAPGTRLIETEFARRLDVSRTPVREAMRRLVHEGLATYVGVGTKARIAVAPATLADLTDLFAVIGALEGVAGRSIVSLSPAGRRSLAADLSRLNARFGVLSQASPRDFDAFFRAHDVFHSRFVERCASDRLRLLIAAVRPQVKRYELLYATAVGHDFSASVREHRAIISAFRSGTAAQVERAIRVNWTNSAARLAQAFRSAPNGLGDYRSVE